MKLRIAIFLAATLSAFAGDAVDQALVDLGADESAKRDAAEKLLWNSDGTAWERAKAVLEKTTDAEVRARLGPIVDWLAVQSKCAPLETAWKDRWFVVRENGDIIGVERQQAVLEDDGGRRTWRFTHETDCILKGSKPEHMRLLLRARHDPHMTPVDGELFVSGEEGVVRLKYTWKGGDLMTEVLESTARRSDFLRKPRGSLALEREGDTPYTVDALMAERIERASLARLVRVEFVVNTFMEGSGKKCLPYAAQFAGIQTVESRGKRMETRRYVHEASEGGAAAEYWVSDSDGLVRAVIDRLELERVDEATARAAGLDPGTVRLKEARGRVSVLVAAQGEHDRAEAELAVLATPEAVAPVREALKLEPDADLKASLTRCANWLDPEFGRTDLTRIWTERYFQVEVDQQRVGAERFGATVTEVGGKQVLGWSGEGAFAGPHGFIRSSWTGRTRFDACLSPLEAEFRYVTEDGQVARWQVGVVDGRAVVRSIEGEKPRYDGATGDGAEEDNEVRTDPTFDTCLSALVERASLCRLPAINLQTWRLGQEETKLVRRAQLKFVEETTEIRDGSPCTVRHYSVSGGNVEHYWVTDAEGLVRMTYYDCTVTPMTRHEWLTTGWDEKSILAKVFKSRLEALRGPDAAASVEALLAFQNSPESLPSLREALASEIPGQNKTRLESLCRWLDPAFGRKELAVLGEARWFLRRKDGARAGWDRVGSRVDADGRWTFSSGTSDTTAPGGAAGLEATFVSPDFGTTNSYDAEIDMQTRGKRILISAEFRGTGLKVKKLIMDGQDFAVPAETRSLSGTPVGAIIPSVLLPLFLERASLARLETVQFSTWDLLGNSRLNGATFVFAGEDRVKVAGKEFTARKYEVAGNGDAGTYWITDEAGVVKCLRDGLESVPTTEADAKKEADDPKKDPK